LAYAFQTFSFEQVLTSAQMSQVEVNVRDHIHGRDSVSKTGISWPRTTKTANFTAVAADIGELFECTTNSFIVNFAAAATLGVGWAVTIANTGSGTITLDPNGAETIDGVATIGMGGGSTLTVWSNGTNLYTYASGGGAHELLERQVPSAVASVDLTEGIFANYDAIVVDYILRPATNGVRLYARLSDDGGSTWESTADHEYASVGRTGGGVAIDDSGTGGTFFDIMGTRAIGNGADYRVAGRFVLYDPGTASIQAARWSTSWMDNATTRGSFLNGGGALKGNTNAINGVQLFFSSGNIAEGFVHSRGLKTT